MFASSRGDGPVFLLPIESFEVDRISFLGQGDVNSCSKKDDILSSLFLAVTASEGLVEQAKERYSKDTGAFIDTLTEL